VESSCWRAEGGVGQAGDKCVRSTDGENKKAQNENLGSLPTRGAFARSSMDVYRVRWDSLEVSFEHAEGSEMSLETKQQNEIGVYAMQVRVVSVAVLIYNDLIRGETCSAGWLRKKAWNGWLAGEGVRSRHSLRHSSERLRVNWWRWSSWWFLLLLLVAAPP
jgi:hypothetical protein